jgi:SWI/SNF-related matrix-associated actin-dependent regulator 1 of chromatin subfamily A
MAPPGTYTLLPQRVRRPVPVDLTSDDPPVDADSGEEDTSRSNIKPSKFEAASSSRVEETPQKRSFDMSGFSYNANANLKRSADELSDSSSSKKARIAPAPRQTGPARAMPVRVDMVLEDVPEGHWRRKVERLQAVVPRKSVRELYDALVKKNWEYQDTLDLVTQDSASEDELLKIDFNPTSTYQPKKTAQRGLNHPLKSIQEKFSTHRTSIVPDTTSSPQQPKRKGRLIRGRRNPSPEAHSSPQRPQQRAQPIRVDSDADEAIAISSDSEAGVSGEEEVDEDSLLNFFNKCSIEEMADLTNYKEEDIRLVFEHRPFSSLTRIEKIDTSKPEPGKKKPRKPRILFGQRLVDAAKEMWQGFGAVDKLVTQCMERGKPLAAAMAGWGVDVFGAAKDGELALTNLEDSDSNSTRDSGLGTPLSSNVSDDELDSLRKGRLQPSKKSGLLKKPSNMSKDIELKDYQVVGLNWLNLLWQNDVSGILADDMGLGKTCQVIAFISHLKQQNVPGPHLIVVPGSTLENWLREFQRFSPELKEHVEPYYGLQAARREQQETILANLHDIYVIVTTYDLAYKPDDNKFLRRCKPQACIYDEGHVLRNSNTARYKSLMRIPAKCRLLLTGTPLQNSLRELASILAFIMPDIFREVEDDLAVVFKLKAKVKEADTHAALLSEQRIERARSMLAPFILRRKKAQVLKHLPKKTTRVEYCELTESQSKLYSIQLERQKQVLLDRANGIPNTEHTNVMMRLRQAAIHPLLFRSHYDDKTIRKISKACLKEEAFMNSNPDVIYEELELYQDYQCHQLATKYPKALGKFALKKEEWMDSGKVQKLAELLKRFKANGDRTLVFSQFTSIMDILQWVLDTLDISYCRLDGQTPISQRQDLLDEFYRDESISVFMLSTKSGGAGINLAAANKVVIFDSSFNPQDDIQAENRAHRVGQTREVEVVRLVTKGTVEEQIHALGVSKLELDKMVAGEEGEAPAKKADKEKLSAAEEMGLEAVEKMMMDQLKSKDKDGADMKEEFLDGLKKAGLDMSAA